MLRRTFLLKTVSRLALAGVMVAATAVTPTMVGAQDSNPEAAKALGEIKGDIRFSWWGGQLRNQKTDEILQLFESENPGVKVARENADWAPYWERLTIQAAGKNEPCTIQMQTRWLATYAKPEILRPLDDLVASGALDITGIPEPVLNASRGADGKLYMIPSGVFYFSLLYNEQMAEKAAAEGVPKLEAPYTWNQFAEYVRAVKPHLGEGVSATHNMGREPDSFVTWVQSQGEKLFEGSKVAFSRDVAIDWFNYWEALRRDGLTESPEEMGTENSVMVEESNLANLRNFITNRPPNQLGSVQKTVDTLNPGATIDIMPYPVGEDGTWGMDLGANGISIGANCPAELLPASVAWINFFTQDPRAAQIYQSDNGVVAIDALAEAQATNPETQPTQVRMIEIYRQVAPKAKPVFWPAGGYQALTDVLNRTYDAVAFEQLGVEEAADQLIAELNEQLANAAR
jgi:multiple sugar transport system substrate-binding protein